MLVLSMERFGGMEECVTALAVALRRQGHDASVLSTVWVHPENQYKRILESNGIRVVQWPFMRLVRPVAWLRAGLPALVRKRSRAAAAAAVRDFETWACSNLGWAYLTSRYHVGWTRRLLDIWWRMWRPDVIHVHSYVYSLNVTHVLDWTRERGVATVFEEHQTPDASRDVWDDFRRRINEATIVGAVSKRAAEVMREQLGVTRPITVLPPIVDDIAATNGAARPHTVAFAERATITTIARLIPVKGLSYLFEAIALLRDTHPSVRLRVYGDGPPRQSEDVQASARRFGLDVDDVFAGTYGRESLPAILNEATVFVLPSLSEGLPLTIVEAMACGRPIVATAVGGVPDVLEHDVTGLLCPPADPASLARALRHLLDNPGEGARPGKAARDAFVRGPFHPEHATRPYVAVYEEAMRIARSCA